LLGLLLDPEDGSDMFLLNVGSFSTNYTALCPQKTELSRKLDDPIFNIVPAFTRPWDIQT
jgi:hypothetical protein